MAEVKYEFTGDEKSAASAIAKLERDYEKLENKIRNTASTSRRGAKVATTATQQAGAAVGRLALQFASVSAAVALVRRGYQEWAQDIEAVSEATAQNNRNLAQQLVLSGNISAGPELQEFFQSLPGVTDAQAQANFNAAAGAAPFLDRNRLKDITTAVAPLQGVQSDAEVEATAAVAANIGEVLPNVSAGDLADLAITVQQRLGERAPQALTPGFERAVGTAEAKGVDTEEGLAFITAAVAEGARGSTVANLLGRLGPGQGIDDLFAGNVELGQEQRDLINLVDPARVAALQQEFEDAQLNDAVLRQREGAELINPRGLRRQEAAATEEDTLRVQADRLDEVRTFSAENRAQLSNGVSRFGVGISESGAEMGAILGVEDQAAAVLQQTGILERIANAVESSSLNRNAQTEGAP